MRSILVAAARVVTSTWFLGALVFLLTWPVSKASLAPQAGLDPSYQGGLHMAAHAGLHFGDEIVFTFGPLGFVKLPAFWETSTGRLALLYQGIVHLGLSLTLVWALRRTLPAAVATGAALVLAHFAIESTLIIAFIWSVAALRPDAPALVRRVFPLAAGAVAAIETLAKLNIGLAILALGVIGVIGVREDWRRRLLLFSGGFVVTLAVLWFGSRQGLGNVWSFAVNSREVVSGFSSAMGLEEPADGTWELWAALVTAGIVLAGARSATRLSPAEHPVATYVLCAVLLFAIFKAGFTRFSPGHSVVFFTTALAAFAAFAGPGIGRAALVTSLAALAIGALAVSRGDLLALTRPTVVFDDLRVAGSPHQRGQLTDGARARMQAEYAVEPSTLALLRGKTVHVAPEDTAAVWAYRLKWRPLPVYQSYVAYTSRLDRINADWLASSRRPERILRRAGAPGGVGLDGRFARFDSPATMRAMFCRYRETEVTSRWQVLAQAPSRCGRARLIVSRRARGGEAVPIPGAGANELVMVRIHGLAPAGLERIRTLLYRARIREVVLDGARKYRFVPETAGDGTILSIPRELDYTPPYELSAQAATIATAVADARAESTHLTYRFYAVPIHSTARG